MRNIRYGYSNSSRYDDSLIEEDITQVLERDSDEDNQTEKNIINYLLLSSRSGRI